MMKKIVFELCSDVISCGINSDYNFLNSLDYIPGSVLRAGFAKDIYLGCEIEDRNNWIELKGDKCSECSRKKICENFSNMKFSFAFLENTVPSPLTTKKCKIKPSEHPIKDSMLNNGILECDECKKISERAGRMEDAKGYIDIKNMCSTKVLKNTLTHTAINYNSRTALDGSLYSTNSIARGQVFEAYIDDCDTEMIKIGTVVYVGKYSSNGYGKLMVKDIIDVEPRNDLKEKIEEFTKEYCSDKVEYKDENRFYIPILLLSDARLGIKPNTAVKTTEEYKNMWHKLVFDDEDYIKIENVFANNRIYAGYDTRQKWGEWKKEPQVETIKGSSFLISVEKDKIDNTISLLEKLLANGIGSGTENGYGRIDVCNEIHMLGVNADANR